MLAQQWVLLFSEFMKRFGLLGLKYTLLLITGIITSYISILLNNEICVIRYFVCVVNNVEMHVIIAFSIVG